MICILALILFSACERPAPGGCGVNPGNGGTTGTDTDTDTDTETDTDTDTETDTDIDTETDTHTDTDEDSVVSTISLNGNTIAADASNAVVNGSVVTITTAGTYNISGSLTDGQIIVDAPDTDVVRLNLNGVEIYCSESAPIFVKNADKVIVTLEDNTENTLTDGRSYLFEEGDDEPNAPLFSKDDLTIKGDGVLTVTGNYKDGIASKNDLRIKGGTITVRAVDDGLRGKDSIKVSGGDITVNAGGDGLKADNAEEQERGIVLIENGTVDITADGDGIFAATHVSIIDGDIEITTAGGSNADISDDASAKGIKADMGITIDGGTFDLNCADDAIHSSGDIVINNGTFTLATGKDAIQADSSFEINGGDITITASYEGIESTAIVINGGNINLTSSDDGLNAVDKENSTGGGGWPQGGGFSTSAYVHINGGYIVVNSGGDGLDSNGAMEITGGAVIVHGPTSNYNGPLDYGSINVTGGLLVAVGSSGMAQAAGSNASSQNALLLNFTSAQRAGNLINIQTDAGKSILTFAPKKTYQSITLSSPDLVTGTSYVVYTGGRSSGTEKDGLYEGGTYTPGTQYTTFTVSGAVTRIGGGGFFPPR